MNNFLPLFLGSDVTKKMTHEELNEIILHAVPNAWVKQSYLQGWYFEMKTYKETCAMLDWMEIDEQVCKVVTPYKTPTRADAKRGGDVSKYKGGESASPTNPKKGRASKRKTKNAGRPSDAPTGAKKTCMLNGPGHSSEECKVLNIYSKKYAAQRPHQNKEARSGGKRKHGKSIEFDDNTQKFNVMENNDDPIP